MSPLLRVAAGATLAATLAFTTTSAVLAQAYPSKPVRIVVPYPPGGASDVTARVLADKLNKVMNGTFVVENRPGANGNIAAELVAKSAPDGYTLLMANVGPNAISQSIYPKLPYSTTKDFVAVTQTTLVPIVLVAGPGVKANNINELVAEIKSNPDKYTFGSAGNGASNHLTGELFKAATGLKLLHVPYKGDSPALIDVMSGRVSMMFTTVVAAMPHIKSGKLKPIAIATNRTVAALPGVPPLSRTVAPGFDAASWGGIVAPAGTSRDIVGKLHAALAEVLAIPDVKEKMASLGAEIIASKPAEFQAYISSETEKWGKVAKANNIVAE